MTIAERVARGVEWLDSKIPNWWEASRFSLADFDLMDGCRCVVAQLSQGWDYGDALDRRWLDLTDSLAWDLGFYAGEPLRDEATDAMYQDLEVEWRRVITERRKATP